MLIDYHRRVRRERGRIGRHRNARAMRCGRARDDGATTRSRSPIARALAVPSVPRAKRRAVRARSPIASLSSEWTIEDDDASTHDVARDLGISTIKRDVDRDRRSRDATVASTARGRPRSSRASALGVRALVVVNMERFHEVILENREKMELFFRFFATSVASRRHARAHTTTWDDERGRALKTSIGVRSRRARLRAARARGRGENASWETKGLNRF